MAIAAGFPSIAYGRFVSSGSSVKKSRGLSVLVGSVLTVGAMDVVDGWGVSVGFTVGVQVGGSLTAVAVPGDAAANTGMVGGGKGLTATYGFENKTR